MIIIGSDHRGFKLKSDLIDYFNNKKYQYKDVGTYNDTSVDYPNIAKILVEEVSSNTNNIGIIICGSGIGVSIAVNRYSNIRGALAFNKEMAKSSRSHNNANVLCLASDYISSELAIEIFEVFQTEEFLAGRHQRRVEELYNLK